MSAREVILLVDDDRTITEGLALLLEREGRTTIVCSDVETAEMMLAKDPVTHLISDVQFSGTFGFEGLHFLSRVRAKAPQCRIVLITGRATAELRATALTQGADELLTKPFTLEELETALKVKPHGGDALPYKSVHVAALDEILNGDALEMLYQPIVMLAGEEPFAYEALTRIRGGWPAGNPADLFNYAAQRGSLPQLNLLAIERALEGTPALPRGATLFINVDPATFGQKALARVIRESAARANFPLTQLVLEITERSAFQNAEEAARQMDALRADGVRFALDDHGSAYSHLALLDTVSPSFIKISQMFGTNLEQDSSKERIVANIASLARDFGCRTIVEGVETADTARAAKALGIELGQGWHFGRPHAAPHWQNHQIQSREQAHS